MDRLVVFYLLRLHLDVVVQEVSLYIPPFISPAFNVISQ